MCGMCVCDIKIPHSLDNERQQSVFFRIWSLESNQIVLYPDLICVLCSVRYL